MNHDPDNPGGIDDTGPGASSSAGDDLPIYDIAELAMLGGVSRRTVRYYVQRGLIPEPTGTGRGKHYGRGHLDALVRVRELQSAGVSLADIPAALAGGVAGSGAGAALPAPAAVPEPSDDARTDPAQTAWIRLRIGDDLELHLRRTRALDSHTAARLAEAIRAVLDDPDTT